MLQAIRWFVIVVLWHIFTLLCKIIFRSVHTFLDVLLTDRQKTNGQTGLDDRLNTEGSHYTGIRNVLCIRWKIKLTKAADVCVFFHIIEIIWTVDVNICLYLLSSCCLQCEEFFQFVCQLQSVSTDWESWCADRQEGWWESQTTTYSQSVHLHVVQSVDSDVWPSSLSVSLCLFYYMQFAFQSRADFFLFMWKRGGGCSVKVKDHFH